METLQMFAVMIFRMVHLHARTCVAKRRPTLKVVVWRPLADREAWAVFSSDVCRVCGSSWVARSMNICAAVLRTLRRAAKQSGCRYHLK